MHRTDASNEPLSDEASGEMPRFSNTKPLSDVVHQGAVMLRADARGLPSSGEAQNLLLAGLQSVFNRGILGLLAGLLAPALCALLLLFLLSQALLAFNPVQPQKQSMTVKKTT